LVSFVVSSRCETNAFLCLRMRDGSRFAPVSGKAFRYNTSASHVHVPDSILCKVAPKKPSAAAAVAAASNDLEFVLAKTKLLSRVRSLSIAWPKYIAQQEKARP
jgi:hypothetical protein